MDYSLLKSIERPPFYLFPRQRRYNLPSNPHVDYINPGLGFVSKVYDFYQPLYSRNSIHCIKKKDNFEAETNAENQEGKGLEDEETSQNEMVEKNDQNVNDKVVEMKDETINKNRKRLSEGVYEAFMHPKIKSAKLHFDDKQTNFKNLRKEPSNKPKKILHKFNVV